MTEKKSRYQQDVDLLKAFTVEKARQRALDARAHLQFMEDRIYEGLGIPKEFIHGKGSGSATIKAMTIYEKAMRHALLYGARPNISMGAAVAHPASLMASAVAGMGAGLGTKSGRFPVSQPNPPTFGRKRVFPRPVPGSRVVIDEHTELYIEGVRNYPPNVYAHMLAAHSPACSTCRYSLACLRGKLPHVCNHCRATFTETTAATIVGQGETALQFERLLCRLQAHEDRVSSSCPLFRNSLIRCADCREMGDKEHPVATRILTQGARYRRRLKRLATVRRIDPAPGFFSHLRQHQGKARGDLHARAQARFSRHPGRGNATQPKQAKRRPTRRATR